MKLPIITGTMLTLQKSDPNDYLLEKYDAEYQYNYGNEKLPVLNNLESVHYPPMVAMPDKSRENCWIPEPITVTMQPEKCNEQLEGTNYIETSSGVFAVKDGEIVKPIINGKIKITRILNVWKNEQDKDSYLVCEVQVTGHYENYEITVLKNRFKDIFKLIRKELPAVNVLEVASEAVQEYLTDIFNRDIEKCSVEDRVLRMGWFKLSNSVHYFKGVDDFYSTISIPNIENLDQRMIFERAWNFLKVGKNGETITGIWLMAHIAFTNYWLKQGGHQFSSVLYVKGATNLLKTSVVKVVANPFDRNRDNATVRMTSTIAGIRNVLEMLQDNLVCIDDFSNTELSSKRKALENAEDVIRAVGDGVFPTKMCVNDFSRSSRESVRATVILTGEEKLNLGRSSQYRIIEVFVDKDTFDGNNLRIFQQNPQIMSEYFWLYVEFLQQYGSEIATKVHQSVITHENKLINEFSVRRFTESTAILLIQIEVMVAFASYCFVNEHIVTQLHQALTQNLMNIMRKNQDDGNQLDPVLKFLYGIWQSLETNKNYKLADAEAEYVKSESKFIGFKEPATNQLWLRVEDTYEMVIKFYKKRGEDFLVQWDTIKKLLLEHGYSKGVSASNGTPASYVLRARRGTRKRMLVLKVEKVEQALENLKEEV